MHIKSLEQSLGNINDSINFTYYYIYEKLGLVKQQNVLELKEVWEKGEQKKKRKDKFIRICENCLASSGGWSE